MKIGFVLPGIPIKPVGGFKIVFEYANRLSQLGHDVTLYYMYTESLKKYILPQWVKKYICKSSILLLPRWFKLDKSVRKYVYEDNIEADVIVVTAITTMPIAKKYDKNKIIYLIQDFENWDQEENVVLESYKRGYKNVVICQWLKSIVDSVVGNSECCVIKNGIDFNTFDIDIPIEYRDKYSISMLYHQANHKGSKYGIKILSELKEKYPMLRATLFGAFEQPDDLPYWIKYVKNATQRELRQIYNESSIFICTTINEGFGLTGAESMACGCALISTDYGGVHEYTIKNLNVLLSPIRDINAMKENIEMLFKDDKKRINLAQNGYEFVHKELNWDSAVIKFEKILYEVFDENNKYNYSNV